MELKLLLLSLIHLSINLCSSVLNLRLLQCFRHILFLPCISSSTQAQKLLFCNHSFFMSSSGLKSDPSIQQTICSYIHFHLLRQVLSSQNLYLSASIQSWSSLLPIYPMVSLLPLLFFCVRMHLGHHGCCRGFCQLILILFNQSLNLRHSLISLAMEVL